MPITVLVNPGAAGLTLCHKGSNGVSMADVPDVCLTPPIPTPVPYPNVALASDLVKGTTTITADGGNMCANLGSEFFKSSGDEGGCAGGVKSGVFAREASWLTYSFDVKLEGKGACRLTDKMFHNSLNTVNAAGEAQSPLLPSKHECTHRVGEWTSGPKFEYEEFQVIGYDIRQIPPTIEGEFYDCFTFRVKGHFVGAVKCTCPECGASTTIQWKSNSKEKSFAACHKINPIMRVMPWGRAKTAIMTYKLVKGTLAMDNAIQEFGPYLMPALEKVEKFLKGSASVICSGDMMLDKVDAWLDAVLAPPMPPGSA